MKPEQFIREQGLDKAREVVEGAPKYAQRYRAGMYLKQGEWTWFWSEAAGKWLQYEKHIYSTSHFDFAVGLSDLKRLVESFDLIEKLGGYGKCKFYMTGMKLNKCDSVKCPKTGLIVSRAALEIAINDYR